MRVERLTMVMSAPSRRRSGRRLYGELLSCASAVRTPGVLASDAPNGRWAVAPLRQWSLSPQVSGFWGGSSIAVSPSTKHRKAAAEIIAWRATDPVALGLLIKEAAVYPSAKKGQALLTTATDCFSNQPDFWKQATAFSHTARGLTFGPNVNVACNAYKDASDKALPTGSSFTDALNSMHNATVDDLKHPAPNCSRRARSRPAPNSSTTLRRFRRTVAASFGNGR